MRLAEMACREVLDFFQLVIERLNSTPLTIVDWILRGSYQAQNGLAPPRAVILTSLHVVIEQAIYLLTCNRRLNHQTRALPELLGLKTLESVCQQRSGWFGFGSILARTCSIFDSCQQQLRRSSIPNSCFNSKAFVSYFALLTPSRQKSMEATARFLLLAWNSEE